MRWLIPLLLIFIIFPVSAQSVSVSLSPSVLFPHDVANGMLTVSSTIPIRITGITFYPSGVEVIPNSVSNVGYVTSYELPFKVIAESEGIHTVKVVISTTNGSITQDFVVRVIGEMPKIVLDRTLLRLNEVNTVSFRISTPVQISNVVVIPLFNAEPRRIFVVNGIGTLRFEPKRPVQLKFEMEFYNGDNYHIITETVPVSYIKSKGVVLNATPEYTTVLKGDVIKVTIQISNLREDDVYSLRLKTEGDVSPKTVEIPILKSGETKEITLLWCPQGRLKLDLSYEDAFGYRFNTSVIVRVKILNESVVQLSGLSVQNGEISGDVCNNGRSKVYNVMVFAGNRSYYIGTIDPSDFESFELKIPNSPWVEMKVVWSNELGQTFSIERMVRVPLPVKHESSSPLPLAIAFATLAFVIVIIIFAARRR